MNEKDCVKITLTYEDGTTQEVNHGFICNAAPSEDGTGVSFTFTMVHISGAMLKDIVGGVLELGMRMGFFGDTEGADDE